jgi:hypothetical protein
MILINLLPPELRRRGGGISPVFASLVGGGIVNGLLLLFYAWVTFIRIPAAKAELAQRQQELTDKTTLANAVNERKNLIAEFEARRDLVMRLLASKVFLARNLDDFANLLTGTFQISTPNGNWVDIPDLRVRALELQIKDVAQAGQTNAQKVTEVSYSFRWKYQIVGEQQQRSGDYVKSFFESIERSPFWKGYGKDAFIGKPIDPYLGDQPVWVPEIQRLVIEGSLEWRRRKQVDVPAPKPKSARREMPALEDAPLLALRTER